MKTKILKDTNREIFESLMSVPNLIGWASLLNNYKLSKEQIKRVIPYVKNNKTALKSILSRHELDTEIVFSILNNPNDPKYYMLTDSLFTNDSITDELFEEIVDKLDLSSLYMIQSVHIKPELIINYCKKNPKRFKYMRSLLTDNDFKVNSKKSAYFKFNNKIDLLIDNLIKKEMEAV